MLNECWRHSARNQSCAPKKKACLFKVLHLSAPFQTQYIIPRWREQRGSEHGGSEHVYE